MQRLCKPDDAMIAQLYPCTAYEHQVIARMRTQLLADHADIFFSLGNIYEPHRIHSERGFQSLFSRKEEPVQHAHLYIYPVQSRVSTFSHSLAQYFAMSAKIIYQTDVLLGPLDFPELEETLDEREHQFKAFIDAQNKKRDASLQIVPFIARL